MMISVKTTLFLAVILASERVKPFSIPRNEPFQSFSGFLDPIIVSSQAQKATCISGIVPVSVTAQTEKFNYDMPPNQTVVTETWVEFYQANSQLLTNISGGQTTISATFNISARLCYPKTQQQGSWKSVQFLTHGVGYNKDYWDFAPGYSFVDIAAEAGYPTFFFDRLGTGASDHPDPIQVVQPSTQVEIAHSLVQMLRAGEFAGQAFEEVIGVGHSYGSILTVGVAASYPEDYSAIVLTGFSTNTTGSFPAFAALNPEIAADSRPDRFSGLSTGYLVVATPIGLQLGYYRFPNFDPSILSQDFATAEPVTLGEAFTLASVIGPSPDFLGPVDVVNGENDAFFCDSDCNYPVDLTAAVQPALYPNASAGSRFVNVPGTGHDLSLHYTIGQSYAQVQEFVKDNGF